MISDLSKARTGDRLVRDGVEYVVIGRYRQPSIILQRADVSLDTPICDHTRLSVDPTSNWAQGWKAVS